MAMSTKHTCATFACGRAGKPLQDLLPALLQGLVVALQIALTIRLNGSYGTSLNTTWGQPPLLMVHPAARLVGII